MRPKYKQLLSVFHLKYRGARLLILFLVLALTTTSQLSLLMPTVVSAESTTSIINNSYAGFINKAKTMAPLTQAKSFAYYKWLRQCMSYGNPYISAADVNNFDWFNVNKGNAKVGVININDIGKPDSTDSVQDCHGDTGKTILKAASTLWGYTGDTAGSQMLCDLQFKPESAVSGVNCTGTSSGWSYTTPNDATGKIDDWYKTTIGFPSTDLSAIVSTGGTYQLYLNGFQKYCGVEADGGRYGHVQIFSPPSEIPTEKDYRLSDTGRGTEWQVNIYEGGNPTCQRLYDLLSSPTANDVKGMVNWIKQNTDIWKETSVDDDKDQYCLLNPSAAKCVAPPSTASSSCAIDGVGWIVCPIVNFLAGLADGSFKLLSDSLLKVDVQLFQSGTSTQQGWNIMRNLANIIFVIVFLFIVFSQLTGVGVSNYGVKKMLPRLVVAAILVNISYFVCQLAVDLSNILGYSLSSALTGVGTSIVQQTASQNGVSPFASGDGFIGIAGGVLALAGAGVLLYTMLSFLIPVLLAAVLALVVILFMLIARQALIVILIVISPLAFVAYLLPNTQKLFTSWRKMMTALLLLFPIIALVFGLSSLTSDIISSSFSSDFSDTATNDWFKQILAAAVLILPLFIVPSLLKKSLDSVPMLGQMASKLSNRANANVSGKVKESYKGSLFGRGRAVRRAAKEEFRNRKYAERLTQDGKAGAIANIAAGGLSSLGITKQQRAQRDAIKGSARATVANAEAKDLSDATKVLEQDIANAQVKQGASFNKDQFLMTRATSSTATETERSAAMHQLASLGRDKQVRELQAQFRAAGDTHAEENLNRAIQANGGALVGKAPDIIKGGAGPAFNNVTGDQMAGFSADTARVHVEHLNDLYQKASAPGATQATRDEFNIAMTSFNSAVADIRSNPTLQAKFAGDVGQSIIKTFNGPGINPAFKAYLPGSIDSSSGKIR